MPMVSRMRMAVRTRTTTRTASPTPTTTVERSPKTGMDSPTRTGVRSRTTTPTGWPTPTTSVRRAPRISTASRMPTGAPIATTTTTRWRTSTITAPARPARSPTTAVPTRRHPKRRAIIRQRSYDVLQKIGEALKNNPDIRRVEIRGYADQRGRSKYNYHLSWERAKVVRQYLINNADVAPDRLDAAGYGEVQSEKDGKNGGEQPSSTTSDSDPKWAKDRRVEFKIVERAAE
ncbi:MAG: OmpA family protein [Bradymonadaceae bacterium]